MRRREFFRLAAGAAIAPRAPAAGRAKITRITITPIVGRFHKTVAMNSSSQPNGDTYKTYLLRVFTDQGVSGTGTLYYPAPDQAMLEALRTLVGANVFDLYRIEARRIRGVAPAHQDVMTRYRFVDSALFDLIGQLFHVPCYELLGEPVRERMEVYDGTLYFSDVMRPEKGIAAVVAEAEESVRAGYRGMKMKVGRNYKWIPGLAGVERDIEVVNAVRKAIGPDRKLMADANNGYRGQFDLAWRFLSETQKSNLFWIEEIFPQDVANYTRLREKMHQAGMKTLIADGEDMNSADELKPYLHPLLIDVAQLDIRRMGFLADREVAKLSAASGGICIPHNWASQIGDL
ncbi:MAG TPA: enolase C-terminal domain-like protein, partial [Bryobacterales bacterium]|nr:enolase C-terminal domain-like protein [Bryobacterales bacterium]